MPVLAKGLTISLERVMLAVLNNLKACADNHYSI
jgi:hypothetical protein